jgi:hypothetical protein
MTPDIAPGNEEIEKALQEFEQKNAEMAPVAVPVPPKTTFVTKITRWLIKYSGGLVTEESGATYLLSGLAVLFILISIFIVMSIGPDIPKAARENPEYGLPITD